MNFDESIYPLSTLLNENNFSVVEKMSNYIKYSSNAATITIAYAPLELLFFIEIGENSKSLIELTPSDIKGFFKDNSFQFQATLTIENLISFLKTSGKAILQGDKQILKNLSKFYEDQSKHRTKQRTHLENIQNADKAWAQKDYLSYIKYIEKTEKELLYPSYLKKYKIAKEKLKNQQ